jgi:hypothetical protein
MNRRRYLSALAIALAAGGWAKSSFSMAETTPEVQSTIGEAPPRDRIVEVDAPPRDRTVGMGFHPGNFIGPIAFDVILRPLPHVAVDLQVGTLDLDSGVHGLAVAPELQWEFRRGWRSTPYVGLGYRHEEDWSDGVTATSKGGFLVGGWQFRWQSGFAALLGGGVLYMTPLTLNTPVASHESSGGWSGTYEVGLRYFF